jgi:hypothetical protein
MSSSLNAKIWLISHHISLMHDKYQPNVKVLYQSASMKYGAQPWCCLLQGPGAQPGCHGKWNDASKASQKLGKSMQSKVIDP